MHHIEFQGEKLNCSPSISRYVFLSFLFLALHVCFVFIVSLPELSGRASRFFQLTDSLFARVCVSVRTQECFSVGPSSLFYDFVSLLISSLRQADCFFPLQKTPPPTTRTHPHSHSQTHLQVSVCLLFGLQFVAV